MSALAAYSRPLPEVRSLSEVQVLLEVSRVVASAVDFDAALDEIAGVTLQITGVLKLEIRGAVTAAWGDTAGAGYGSARARIGERGELKIYFELKQKSLGSPLRFARFLSNQIANLLVRQELLERRSALKKQILNVRGIISRRKTIHRARAIVCHANGLTEAAALALLRQHSRDQGKSLHEVADAIVVSEARVWKKPTPIPHRGRGWFSSRPGFGMDRSWHSRS